MKEEKLRALIQEILEEHGSTEYARIDTQADILAKAIMAELRAEEFNVVFELNTKQFEEQLSAVQSILQCHHHMNGRRIPCPPTCPRQSWPEYKFKRTWHGHWKLRKQYA